MPLNLLYELKKCEDISYADPLRLKSGGTRPPRPPPIGKEIYLGKEICHHLNGNKLHKVQESAVSAVGHKHQAGEG